MIEAARTLRRQDQKSGPGMQLLVLVFVATAAFVAPFVSWFLLTPKPQNIRIANLGAHSFSVAWTTTRPSTGCAVTSFLKGKDFSLKQSCSKQRRKAHFVEVEKLLPETDYSLYILGGIRLTKHKSVLTQKIRTLSIREAQPEVPDPSYGSIVYEDNSPAPGVSVFIYKDLSDRFRYPIAGSTNEQGNFALDLANLNDPEDINNVGGYVLEVMSLEGSLTSQKVDKEITTPFPTFKIANPR